MTRARFVRVALAAMAVLAVLKLGDEFRRLLFDMGDNGAVDLRHRHKEVLAWFSGAPVYKRCRRRCIRRPATSCSGLSSVGCR